MSGVSIFADSLSGGLGVSAIHDAMVLSQWGNDVALYSIGPNPTRDNNHFKFVDIQIPDKLSFRAFLGQTRKLIRIELRKAIHENNVIIVHGLRTALLLAPSKKIHLIIHGDGGYLGEAKYKTIFRKILLRLITYFVGTSYTVSTPLSSRWKQVWVSSPNINSKRLVNPRRAKNTINLLWFGRIDRPKRIDTFIEVISLAQEKGLNIQGEIWGPVIETSSAGLLDKYKQLPLAIHNGNFIPGDVLKGDKIFCLFSDFEGRPFSTEEAISFGLPVLGSDLPGHRLMIGDDELLVSSAETAVEALNFLLSYSDRRNAALRQRTAMTQAKQNLIDWEVILRSVV